MHILHHTVCCTNIALQCKKNAALNHEQSRLYCIHLRENCARHSAHSLAKAQVQFVLPLHFMHCMIQPANTPTPAPKLHGENTKCLCVNCIARTQLKHCLVKATLYKLHWNEPAVDKHTVLERQQVEQSIVHTLYTRSVCFQFFQYLFSKQIHRGVTWISGICMN